MTLWECVYILLFHPLTIFYPVDLVYANESHLYQLLHWWLQTSDLTLSDIKICFLTRVGSRKGRGQVMWGIVRFNCSKYRISTTHLSTKPQALPFVHWYWVCPLLDLLWSFLARVAGFLCFHFSPLLYYLLFHMFKKNVGFSFVTSFPILCSCGHLFTIILPSL